ITSFILKPPHWSDQTGTRRRGTRAERVRTAAAVATTVPSTSGRLPPPRGACRAPPDGSLGFKPPSRAPPDVSRRREQRAEQVGAAGSDRDHRVEHLRTSPAAVSDV